MILEFLAVLVEHRLDGHGTRVAQDADRYALHVRTHIENHLQVRHFALAVLDPMQHLLHPPRTLAALGTLAARLFRVEPRGAESQTYHAGGLVDHHHSAGSQ